MNPRPVTLIGKWAELVPLAPAHTVDLFAAAQDEEIWQWMPVHMPRTLAEMEDWVANALGTLERGEMIPFTIMDRASGRAIGSTRYLDLSSKDRHIEIGWTWLAKNYWRTPINTECKYLLLKHAFEDLGCIRVQLKTDLRNVRSQRAIERLGAVREGVLRKAVIIKDGYQRWTVYYSILDDEWRSVKARLETFMAVAASDGKSSEHSTLSV